MVQERDAKIEWQRDCLEELGAGPDMDDSFYEADSKGGMLQVIVAIYGTTVIRYSDTQPTYSQASAVRPDR